MVPASPKEGGLGRRSVPASRRRGPLRLVSRTLTKAWDDNIFSESAAAAFWQTLSLPPLLLGLLGSLGFVGDWLGPEAVSAVQDKIVDVSDAVFSNNVVNQIIGPTVVDILTEGRPRVVSVAFLLSLWAGSSALASLIDSITLAYDQYLVRNAVWQRTFALLLYLASLVMAVLLLPVLALGPAWLPTVFPETLRDDVVTLIRVFYYPATGAVLVLALTTLYKVALPRKLPWHRGVPGALLAMLVFLCSSVGLRLYITWVTGTGYTYGALATPIAFLLFAFFIGFAIISGAQFNNAIQEVWPAGRTRRQRRRWRRLESQRTAQRLHTEEGYAAWAKERQQRDSPGSAPRRPADTGGTRRNDSRAGAETSRTGERSHRRRAADDSRPRDPEAGRGGNRHSSPPGGSPS